MGIYGYPGSDSLVGTDFMQSRWILESRGIGKQTHPAQQIFDIFCLALGTTTARYQISQSARLRNLDSHFLDRMRFLVQCDSVFVLLGAKTGKDDFTFLSFMNVASFSNNYCVTLGKLFVFWTDRGS